MLKKAGLIFLLLGYLVPDISSAQVQDLAGYWAPILTEDYELRTMGVKSGDYGGIPLNDAGKAIADDYTKRHPDEEWFFNKCGPHGPPRIMFSDTRLHITQDDKAIAMDLEAEGRTREFFLTGALTGTGTVSWQGQSVAHTDGLSLLSVVTRDMQPGLLRDNGVPYSEQAVLTEHFSRHGEYFTVIVVVEDPKFLDGPFISSTSFKKISRPEDWLMGNCKQ